MLDLPREDLKNKETTNNLKIEFTGSGGSYAKIWFVNLALTIITLGIYGPWAKVRNKRYLYSCTEIEGNNFDFTANPVAILKGRALFIGLFIIYSVAEGTSFVFTIAMLTIFAVVLPWLIKKSLRFRMRYSEFKGLSFRSTVTSSGIFINFLLFGLLKVLSLGLLTPLFVYKQKKYVVENTFYGNHNLNLNGNIKGMYLAYLKPILISLLPLFLITIFSTIIIMSNPERLSFLTTVFVSLLFVSFFFILSLVKFAKTKYVIDNLSIENFHFNLDAGYFKYAYIVITNAILFLITLGLATPFCIIRLQKYFLNNIKISGDALELNNFTASVKEEISAFGDEVIDLEGMEFEFGL